MYRWYNYVVLWSSAAGGDGRKGSQPVGKGEGKRGRNWLLSEKYSNYY